MIAVLRRTEKLCGVRLVKWIRGREECEVMDVFWEESARHGGLLYSEERHGRQERVRGLRGDLQDLCKIEHFHPP
jgi:hypothetical protein